MSLWWYYHYIIPKLTDCKGQIQRIMVYMAWNIDLKKYVIAPVNWTGQKENTHSTVFHKMHHADLNNLCGFKKGKLQTSLSSNDHVSTLDVSTPLSFKMLTYWTCTWLNWTVIAKCTGFRRWGQGVVLHLAEIQISAKEACNILATFKVI